ncbi:MAG: hypothetical protein ACJ762_18150 [Solirubrobacteraceae bacterium]
MQAAIRDVPEEARFTAEAGDELAGFLPYRLRPHDRRKELGP